MCSHPVRWRRLLVLWTMISLFLIPLAVFAGTGSSGQTAETECNMHQGACRVTLGERVVELEISPKPVKAMADLTFRVMVNGPPLADAPHIDLGMPGMKMGPNRVAMEKAGQNTYTGKGVIVRCPSGKTTWRATVTVPELGRAAFVFDVVY